MFNVGAIGVISMLFLSLDEDLHIFFALLALTAGSASVAIADVTIDACVAQKSGTRPLIAPDMQSLCALSSSIGALVGYSFSGILVHLIGPVVSFCSFIWIKFASILFTFMYDNLPRRAIIFLLKGGVRLAGNSIWTCINCWRCA